MSGLPFFTNEPSSQSHSFPTDEEFRAARADIRPLVNRMDTEIDVEAHMLDSKNLPIDYDIDEVKARYRLLAKLLIFGGENGERYTPKQAYLLLNPGVKESSAIDLVNKIRRHPAFQEAYKEELTIYRDGTLQHPLMTKRGQAEQLLERHARLLEIINARASAAEDDMAGGETGLIVRQKFEGGRTSDSVDEKLLKQLMQIENRLVDLGGDAPYKKLDVTSNGERVLAPVIYLPSNNRDDAI